MGVASFCLVSSCCLAFAAVGSTLEPAADALIAQSCPVTHTGNDFQSNRHDGLSHGTLQVTLWYDGSPATPTLQLQLKAPSGVTGWITIGAGFAGGSIEPFTTIETRQYTIGDCRLTGLAKVAGVVDNGAIDGLAFGLMAKYGDGTYRVIKSVGRPSTRADFVGSWPIGFDTRMFVERASDLSGYFGREQGWMMLYGAQYLRNGFTKMPVCCDPHEARLDEVETISGWVDWHVQIWQQFVKFCSKAHQ